MSDEVYNTLPYLVQSYVQSSPDRLATMARLHGLSSPPVAARIDERPRASPVARLQAMERPRVANLYHEQVALGEAEAALLPLLDGTRDRAMLRDPAHTPAVDGALVDAALERLRRSALLLRREGESDHAGI